MGSPPTTTTEQEGSWAYDPTKCGTTPSESGLPPGTFYVTATIQLWSQPTTSSTSLGTISVSQYGAGGIGCPTAADPTVTVECRTDGQPIPGPFTQGGDPVWERVTYNGTSGYVADEWVDTQSARGTLPGC